MSEQQKNRITVEIYGQSYHMVGAETTDHMLNVAKMVDDKMREIQLHNRSLDSSKLAVLTAVNAMHDLLKLKERVEQLEQQLINLKG